MSRALAVVVVGLPASARAHDLWLLPTHGSAPAITVEAAQGKDFPASDGPPKRTSFEKLEVIAPDGSRSPLEWRGAADGKAKLRFSAKTPGLYIAAASTTQKMIELDAAEFNEYLVSDGLSHVWLERSKKKELDRPAKERYQKWVKAIVRTGAGPGDPTRSIGHVLEIVPAKDPTELVTGDVLEVSVLFRGQPLADARVGCSIDKPIG